MEHPQALLPMCLHGCDNLTTIYVPWSEGDVANAPWGATNATIIYNKDDLIDNNKIIYFADSQVTLGSIAGGTVNYTVTSHTFENGQGTITFNKDITEIPKVLYNTGITGVKLPNSATSMALNAFRNCYYLDLNSLPPNLSSLNQYAFENARSLSSLNYLPNNLKYISSNAFRNCYNLRLKELPSSISTIYSSAFSNCSSLVLSSIPSTVKLIDQGAFSGCRNLILSSLPSTLSAIEYNCFGGCTSLALTSLPNTITKIKRYGFENCSSLRLSSLPDGITIIDQESFSNCSSLALTSLPSQLNEIGIKAFENCTSLQTLTFNRIPTSIASSAFNGCTSLTSIYVPWQEGAVSGAPWGATNATIFYAEEPEEQQPDTEIWYYAPAKVTLGSNTGVASHTFSDGKGVIMGTGSNWLSGGKIYSTADNTFKNCSTITNVTFPSTWTRFNRYVFQNCTNLALSSLPTGTANVYRYAFQNCVNVTISSLPTGIANVGMYAFDGCTGITSMTFHTGIAKIEEYAFGHCTGLTEVTFLGTPATSIHANAFTGCTNLTTIRVPWSQGAIADAPWGATNATIIYNYSGN